MNSKGHLFCLYEFLTRSHSGHYYLLATFSDKGAIPSETLVEEFSNINELDHETFNKLEAIGPFEDVEILKSYCLSLCHYHGKESISLITTEEYNHMIEKVNSTEELLEQIESTGAIYLVPEQHKNKGLLGKIFT